MSNEYQLKIEECLRQKEEITHLLAKVGKNIHSELDLSSEVYC